jgi:hypothetical protein
MAIDRRTIWIVASDAGWFDFARRAIPAGVGTLSQRNDTWFLLDSPRFAQMSVDDVHAEAKVLLVRLTAIAHLYQPGRKVRFGLHQVVETEGQRHGAIKQIVFSVVEQPDEALLTADHTGEVRAHRLWNAADTDEDTDRGFRLLREHEVTWPTIYDLIEFLRTRVPIGPDGWISKNELDRYRQTANYYRHMGRDNMQLPAQVPTLFDAEQLFVPLLRRWLVDALKLPDSGPPDC